MEYTLLMLMFVFAMVTTLLSTVLDKVIFLRIFSGILLASTAYGLIWSPMIIGFGDNNVIPYTGLDTDDPGMRGTREVARALGFISALQFIYVLKLSLEMVGKSKFGGDPDKLEKYT